MSKPTLDGMVAYVRDHWAICTCICILAVGAIKDSTLKTAQVAQLQADVQQLQASQPRIYTLEAKLDYVTSMINNVALDVREIRANQNDKGK